MAAAEGLEYALEIVVSDNASTDNTINVVQGFQEKFCLIRYHRNAYNIGASKNISLSTSLTHGRYLWVFGDDDVMSSGAIKIVLRKIQEKRPDVIVCNYTVLDKDLQNTLREQYYNLGQEVDVISDRSEFLKLFGASVGFISSVVIRRKILLNVDVACAEQFMEYGFSHLYAIYSALNDNCNVFHIRRQIFINRAGVSGGYDWYKYFLDGLAMIFATLKREGYAGASVRAAKNSVIIDFIVIRIIYDRISGALPSGILVRILRFYPDCWSAWFLCLPIFLIPRHLLRMARWIYKRYRNGVGL